MYPEFTLWDELIRAATRAGLFGCLILYSFCGVYLLALFHLWRRRFDKALQDAVIELYIVAGFNLQGIAFMLVSLQSTGAMSWQSAMLWVNTYLRLQLSLVLICSLAPIVLLAVLASRKTNPVRNPGCVPGAIISLLTTVILDLFISATVFGKLYYHYK